MTVDDQLRRWLVAAADAAIKFSNRSEIAEGAKKFRSAIEVAAPIPFKSQMQPALGNLHRASDTPRARESGVKRQGLRPLSPAHQTHAPPIQGDTRRIDSTDIARFRGIWPSSTRTAPILVTRPWPPCANVADTRSPPPGRDPVALALESPSVRLGCATWAA